MAIVKNASVNMEVQVRLSHIDFTSCGYIPSNGIINSYVIPPQ